MEKLRKVRGVKRGSFTKLLNAIKGKLTSESSCEDDWAEVEGLFDSLQQKFEEIRLQDAAIFEMLVEDENTSEEALEMEETSIDEVVQKFHCVCAIIKEKRKAREKGENESLTSKYSSIQSSNDGGSVKRKFKLPQVELKKFSGEVKEWLPFWSQFKQIDEDDSLEDADKIHYLWQATTPGSRARQLVASYPQSGENYKKVVAALKARFGKRDLLVEVYVRELLKLVILNTHKENSNLSLSVLYDAIEAHLRALETLDVAPESCAAILFPLVESCLPEELLRAWQRTQSHVDDEVEVTGENGVAKRKLAALMNFIRREVEGEEKISLAMAGLTGSKRSSEKKEKKIEERKPTAASLLTQASSCLFCNEGHSPTNCCKACKIPYEKRRELVAAKKYCFSCLSPGHISRWCKATVTCTLCSKRHVTIMCPKGEQSKASQPRESDKKPRVENNLAAVSSQSTVLLQTLQVLLVGDRGERRVRALFDTGSQRSYLKREVAAALGYESRRSELLGHSLFGVVRTEESRHEVYLARVYSVVPEYACNFEVLSQDTISGTISSVPSGLLAVELQKKGVVLSDDGEGPIDLLLGADVVGKLMTGRQINLDCGVTAIETSLGWTVMGKITAVSERPSTMMFTHTLLNNVDVVKQFWTLETLGINDPTERQTRQEHLESVNKFFDETVKRSENGRFVVQLPWRGGLSGLANTRQLALQRTENKYRRLKAMGQQESYEGVFREWQEEQIIERAPPLLSNEQFYYLPHRPVWKTESTTTKVRPVFDASAKNAGSLALNDCLEVGENLVELIPDVLLRFRLDRIGVSADVKKAFLQIEIAPQDRNFLRFFLIENDDAVEYRHARLVFGLCCSPFLLGAAFRHLASEALRDKVTGLEEEVLRTFSRRFYVDNFLCSVKELRELEEVKSVAIGTLKRAGFELRGWEHTADSTSLGESPKSKILGLVWDRRKDTLAIAPERLTDSYKGKITKRLILSTTQRIFDPIGFTTPATIIPKILLQKTWVAKLRWDEEVDSETAKTFVAWAKTLSSLASIEIPRWSWGSGEDELSLHVFVDASKRGYRRRFGKTSYVQIARFPGFCPF